MIYGLHICMKVADCEQLCIECTVMRFGARTSNMNIHDGFDSKNLETAVISPQECVFEWRDLDLIQCAFG